MSIKKKEYMKILYYMEIYVTTRRAEAYSISRMKGGFKMAFGAGSGVGAGIAIVVVIILLLIAMGIVF